MKKTVALHNLGCKVNAYELEAIQQLLENRGYEIVPFAPGADVYIINTCTVTNIADRKSRQMLHKAKKMNPDAVVVACGCYVQAAGEKLEEDTAIDLIIGNNKKKDLVDILENFLAEREDGGKPSDAECKSFLVDMTHNREYETLSISKTAEHTRAFLKVQDGCNQFCTYCIIPYARGRVRSRRQSDVVEEVKRLAEAGYQEVVLTGIHLSSYGLDFPEGEKETLLDLIRAVDAVDGIRRIRLGSLEPGIITEEFAEAIAALKKSGIEKTVMLTGDAKNVADHVAAQLGIDEVCSELLPGDKVEKVEELLTKKSEKDKLAFVGDGINDAPVLSRADIGIAMGALGSDAAIEAADIVLMDDDPLKISKAIRISRKCIRIVYENIYFAIGIKVICLVLGALGIANMWFAIFADVGVMIIAVLNAIRTLFVKKL